MGEGRYDRTRGNIFTKWHHGDNPRRSVDATKNPNGGEQRLALLEPNLLRVISPVQFKLSASVGRMNVFGGLSRDAT